MLDKSIVVNNLNNLHSKNKHYNKYIIYLSLKIKGKENRENVILLENFVFFFMY